MHPRTFLSLTIATLVFCQLSGCGSGIPNTIPRLYPLYPGFYSGSTMISYTGTQSGSYSYDRDDTIGPNGLPTINGIEVYVGATFEFPWLPGATYEVTAVVATDDGVQVDAAANSATLTCTSTETYKYVSDTKISFHGEAFARQDIAGSVPVVAYYTERGTLTRSR